MALRCLRSFSIPPFSSSKPRHSTAPINRRGLLPAGVFCVLSLGVVTALSFRTRSRYLSQSLAKGIHSARMEATNNIVPSIVVYVTVPNKEAGKKLAGSIIKEKLAACVNIVPGVESVYWWDNKVQSDSEELLIIKTRESLLGALTEHVKTNHEYDVPEVISLPITGGNDKYLEWIKNNTRDE